jgi:hypothetical protein
VKDYNLEKLGKLCKINAIVNAHFINYKYLIYQNQHYNEEDLLINIIEDLTKAYDSFLDKLVDLNMRSPCSIILQEKS